MRPLCVHYLLILMVWVSGSKHQEQLLTYFLVKEQLSVKQAYVSQHADDEVKMFFLQRYSLCVHEVSKVDDAVIFFNLQSCSLCVDEVSKVEYAEKMFYLKKCSLYMHEVSIVDDTVKMFYLQRHSFYVDEVSKLDDTVKIFLRTIYLISFYFSTPGLHASETELQFREKQNVPTFISIS